MIEHEYRAAFHNINLDLAETYAITSLYLCEDMFESFVELNCQIGYITNANVFYPPTPENAIVFPKVPSF